MSQLIKTPAEIAKIRQAGQIVGSVLADLAALVICGARPHDLDQYARETIRQRGGQPAFIGYQGYPATLCISVNNAVVHGLPTAKQFVDGDLVGIDAGAIVDGWYADAAITLGVGQISVKDQHLLTTTQEALQAGIVRARAGRRLGDVQAAIQRVIEAAGLGIIRDLTGHGIGRQLHEEPQIPNYGRAGSGLLLQKGLVICLEPMVTLGSPEIVLDQDRWTIRTLDGSKGAQFEHTILITDDEAEILTPLRAWPEPESLVRG